MDKLILSDHCPGSITCVVNPTCSLQFIRQCVKGAFNDNHWDINQRKNVPLQIEKIDWVNALPELERQSQLLYDRMQNENISNDHLHSLISSTIYDVCKKNYKVQPTQIPAQPEHHQNCSSKHFIAIAQINKFTYETHIREGASFELCSPYLQNWLKFEQLARVAENKELNLRTNSSWRKARKNGKKLWDMIDWKGKADVKKETLIQDYAVDSYFRDIFQSKKTKDHPVITTIKNKLDAFEMYIPLLDDIPDQVELLNAIAKLGSGCGLDGIPADVIRMLPQQTLNLLLNMMRNTFTGKYPTEWQKQILHALPKDGHTIKFPKLRGISIAPILARLYDYILYARFKKWYVPNREQAGFRSGQGCLLQIFILVLSIHYAREKKLNLIIAFMDYEKAFDFANRAEIISKLIDKGCGKRFTDNPL